MIGGVIEVVGWPLLDLEPWGPVAGARWLEAPLGGPLAPGAWLFQPRGRMRRGEHWLALGEDWARKVTADVGVELGLPVAEVHLARCGSQLGTLVRDVSDGRFLVPGSEVLAGAGAPRGAETSGEEVAPTPARVFEALEQLEVEPPPGVPFDSAGAVLAAMLVVDALVGNGAQDLETTWGVVTGPPAEGLQLAALLPPGTCLGHDLTDAEREERLATRERELAVAGYAERAVAQRLPGTPSMVAVAAGAVAARPAKEQQQCREALEALDEATLGRIVGSVPGPRMSDAARTFAVRLLAVNRRRLLGAFEGESEG
jgi:hypothetical protein